MSLLEREKWLTASGQGGHSRWDRFIRLRRGRGGWLSGRFDGSGRLLGRGDHSLRLFDGQCFEVRSHDNSPFRIFEIGTVPQLMLQAYTTKCIEL